MYNGIHVHHPDLEDHERWHTRSPSRGLPFSNDRKQTILGFPFTHIAFALLPGNCNNA